MTQQELDEREREAYAAFLGAGWQVAGARLDAWLDACREARAAREGREAR